MTTQTTEDYQRVVAERDRLRTMVQLLEEELNLAMTRLAKYENHDEKTEFFHINHGD